MFQNLLAIASGLGFSLLVLAVGLDNGFIGAFAFALISPFIILASVGMVFHYLLVKRMERGYMTDKDMAYMVKICG